jgi:cytochrome P450
VNTPLHPPLTPADVDLFAPATMEDWYPAYDVLREQAPVWQMPGTRTYVLTRYEDVAEVLRRTDVFGRGGARDAPARSIPERVAEIYRRDGWPRVTYLATEPPVHRQYRDLVDHFFTPAGADRRRPLIQSIVDHLLGTVAPLGRCEFMASFAVPLPVRVITEMMGFPAEDIPQLKVWSEAWVLPVKGTLTADEEEYAGAQGVAFQRYIHATMQAKRAQPDDSVISHLVNEARFAGERPLRDEEVISIVDHLYIGGNETTTFALTNGMYLLLTVPGALEALRADTTLVRQFVEESLRLESPTMGLNRVVWQDVEIGGVAIPKGSTVHLRYAAANRDHRTFPDPTRLDLERANSARHVAFSYGETHCPGAGLSRLEQVVAFTSLVARLPGLRLTPGRNDFTHHANFTLRAMKELWIDYDRM